MTESMRTVTSRSLIGAILAALVGLLMMAAPTVAVAAPAAPAAPTAAAAVPGQQSGLQVRALSSLPSQATDTYRLIQRGGPYPYDRDGITFQNREGILPQRASGFYREYTVRTPGVDHRGARRIVTGGGVGPNQEIYYTADHYASFVVVDVTR